MACDHGDPAAVDALVDGIESDVRQIDLLVNHAWGGHESFDGRLEAPCWDHPSSLWQTMMDGGVRLHLLAARAAAQRVAARRRGPIVATTLWDRGRPLKGNLHYDIAKAAINRRFFAMAEELRRHDVASLALSPGWMRTQAVLAGHRADETRWKEVPALAHAESPRNLGRAVAALAADPEVLRPCGKVARIADLAALYGVTDIEGRRAPAFERERT